MVGPSDQIARIDKKDRFPPKAGHGCTLDECVEEKNSIVRLLFCANDLVRFRASKCWLVLVGLKIVTLDDNVAYVWGWIRSMVKFAGSGTALLLLSRPKYRFDATSCSKTGLE